MNNPLSRNEIITLIGAEKPFLKENFGVIHIGIFGSYAKNRQTIDGNIDHEIIFDICANHLPKLRKAIQKLLFTQR